MAAGISTKEKHQIECRMLKGIQRDLEKVALPLPTPPAV